MTTDERLPDTKHRYCKTQAKDGRICSLYLDHISEEHVENHQRSRWKDGE